MFSGLSVLSTIPSCLETLPGPLQCPAKAKYDACAAQGPIVLQRDAGAGPPLPPAPSGTEGCVLPVDCLLAQGRICECTAAGQCTRENTCSPPPDCPSSVRGAAAGATCIDGTTSFPPQKAMCACGCASCAKACDGQGPTLGAGQGLRVELPSDLPSSGVLGVMVRVRGTSLVTALVNFGTKTKQLSAPATSHDEFVELILGGPPADWSETKPLGMVVSSPESVEIDCIVPYFTP